MEDDYDARIRLVAPDQFDPDRLIIARMAANLTQTQLADAISLDGRDRKRRIGAWERGEERPGPEWIERLAGALSVFPIFFASTGRRVSFARPLYSKASTMTAHARDRSEAFLQMTGDVLSHLASQVRFVRPDLPHISGLGGGVEVADLAAHTFRVHLGLGSGPIDNVTALLADLGVAAIYCPPDMRAVRSYAQHIDGWPIVVVNPTRIPQRIRFDVVHEVAHLIMHKGIDPGDNKDLRKAMEDQANRFAASFLLPSPEIGPWLAAAAWPGNWPELYRVMEHWGVPIKALIRRAFELKILDERHYDLMMMKHTAKARDVRRDLFASGDPLAATGSSFEIPGRNRSPERTELVPEAVARLNLMGGTVESLREALGLPSRVLEAVIAAEPILSRGGAASAA